MGGTGGGLVGCFAYILGNELAMLAFPVLVLLFFLRNADPVGETGEVGEMGLSSPCICG